MLLVGAAAVAVAVWRRGRDVGGPTLGRCLRIAALVVGGAILPTGYALAHYTGMLSHTGAGVAGVDREMTITMLVHGIEECHDFLRQAMIVAAALGVLTTIGLARALRRSIATPSLLDEAPHWLPPAAVVAALGLVGAGLYLRREATTPWPEPSRAAVFNVGLFDDAAAPGPDEAAFAPVLEVLPHGVAVDGSRLRDGTDRAGLETLVVLRNNYLILHPGETFPGKLGVVCRGDVPARRLDDVLQRVAVLGYVQPSLLLPRSVTIDRPVLGRLVRAKPTAIALHVPQHEGQKGWLPVAPARTCRDFTTRALAARGKSNYLQVALDWTPEAAEFAPPPPTFDMDDLTQMARKIIEER